ncbi:Sensor protein ZraS [Rubripirellula tenax]|uniref:histidine kinase n=1 Tax=Rubripirellula tenax TaxID=2528015 RepID=A0A5C6EN75_9BACT|nr:ATP-binding protein [Rubripirellula tenax]TWU50582.1 Sensor protein ZraS [Rubripirellula tenax]
MRDELNILLVEDDPDGQANLVDVLELDGHQVRVVSSLGEIRDAGVRDDVELVILDRLLPDGNVEDALPELTEWLPQAEFIVVTGFADVESTIKAFRLGVTDYMLKPVHPDVIRQSVARIARQKRIEMELHQQQQFANQILDTAEGFIVVLDLQGRVVRVNQHFTKVTGWQQEQLVGKEYIEHCIPEVERVRLREVFHTAVDGNQCSGVCNGVLTTTGRVRQIRWSNSTLKNRDGTITAVLGIGVDVTDVIEAQEAAARDHRLAAIGQTVAGLAHESRNALHRIQTAVEILRLDIPIESECREEVDSVARAATELNNTLEEVRQFAAPIHLHRESVLLHEVWQRVWGYLSKVRGNRDAQLVDADCGCPVKVDVLRMEQVFRNLFENSLAACEDPVCIHVRCKCDGPEMILVEMEDNGPGLDAEQREKLFEPFYTTKARGTGLGMSIAQRVVEAHGGDIQVGDAPEQGAKFLIRLRKEFSR